MAGLIKQLLGRIIDHRARGNVTVANVVKTKLILKGLNPDKYSATSPDDPATVQKVRETARELGVAL